ncbi:chloride channel protein, CIC family [Solitalea koreensis]|uniref:Chloride channel protein, CIC family n=2 Tax=Solitalea koreensis TaxID=543615 RepID=A0A521ACN5_9SPHI|nr:chloride channel protein, CIC family [Solitalea koreensis]
MVLSGILVGLTAGMASVILKTIVHYIHRIYLYDFPFNAGKIGIYFLPLIGILITVFIVQYFFKGNDGRGIANILYDIARRSSLVDKIKMYSQVITSGITVGFGGSSGLEGPIAVTGSAIGSNFARSYGLNYKDRTLLVAAGGAAGIAGAFNAPITGVMFAMEVLLVGVAISEFIPLIIAAVCGALCTKVIFNEEILFHFKSLKEFSYYNVFFYVLLGVFCGFLSVYFARATHFVEHFFEQMGTRYYKKALIGGLLLAVLCFLFPPLQGDGYESVKLLASNNATALLNGSVWSLNGVSTNFLLLFVLLVGLVKVFATSLTLASGGNGGTFAPALFTGAFAGNFFASLFNLVGLDKQLPIANFTLVGMAGMLSGVMYAPLTGIFLIAEITGGYDLILPLMIVSVSSYVIAHSIEPFSMDTKIMATSGDIFSSDYDANILNTIRQAEFVETEFLQIEPVASIAALLALFGKSNASMIAVIDDGDFKGWITFDDVRSYMFDQEKQTNKTVADIMRPPRFFVNATDSLHSIMEKFDSSGLWYLPVLDQTNLIGFISKSDILHNYRKELARHSGKY